jgi:hypothetical protein
MNTAMSALSPLRIRGCLAVCFLITAGPALADEDFSEHWLLERELEMTRNLTIEIDGDVAVSMNRNIEQQLARFDSQREGSTPSPPAAAAPRDTAADIEAAAAKRPRMSCHAGPDHSLACVVHPAY